MRAALLGTLGLLALTTVVGCGPGLTRHSRAAKAPDVFATMDAELANAVSTTTVTSGDEQMPLPESRLSVAQWEEDETPPQPAVQTWGVAADVAPKSDPASYP